MSLTAEQRELIESFPLGMVATVRADYGETEDEMIAAYKAKYSEIYP